MMNMDLKELVKLLMLKTTFFFSHPLMSLVSMKVKVWFYCSGDEWID